jgi:O-antigen/teichoic acid export membrane protein
VFAPIEEISFNLFSKYSDKNKSLFLLARILQIMIFIGSCAIVFGFLFSEPFLRILYTDKWASPSAVSIMKSYCIYCFFLPVNGIVESYAYSKSDHATIRKLQYSLIIITIIYISVSIGMCQIVGIEGLIFGNCVNMSLRIIVSLYFIFDKEAIIQGKLKSDLIKEFIAELMYITLDINYINKKLN